VTVFVPPFGQGDGDSRPTAGSILTAPLDVG
jgi:hypothetical protein